jgi:hypothetical protein
MTRKNCLLGGALCVLGAIPMSACDGQAQSDFPGDSLGTLQGTIRSEATLPPASSDVVLLWRTESEPDVEVLSGHKVTVQGEFPASFTLDLYEPPPDETMHFVDAEPDVSSEYRISASRIDVYPAGTTEYGDENALSWEEHHLVVYAEQEIPAGATVFSDAVVPAGYGLFDPKKSGNVVVPIDTAIEIRLVDDTSVLASPYYDDDL